MNDCAKGFTDPGVSNLAKAVVENDAASVNKLLANGAALGRVGSYGWERADVGVVNAIDPSNGATPLVAARTMSSFNVAGCRCPRWRFATGHAR
ncbi:hypothetical protein ACFYV7_02985 [Nocardia suismassiliense]|uniref:Uncharacterized protein n=1 Tax=Nocardia suismassiliense TaxID=2077092 RepID=A0ABW6QKK0_9NOCA